MDGNNSFRERLYSNTSNFNSDEIKLNGNPVDFIDTSMRFIRKHWDDIIIVLFVLFIVFLFALYTGFEYKPDSDLENNIRKILFRSSPEDYQRDKDKKKESNQESNDDYATDDKIFIVEDDETPDTERYQFND